MATLKGINVLTVVADVVAVKIHPLLSGKF